MMSGFLIALLITMSYSIVAMNTIAISRKKYVATGVTSLIFMVVNFFLIRHVAEAKTVDEFIGYCVGGVAGDFLGIYLSNKFNI